MLKIGLLTLFKQFPTQKVAGMISFSYICKQKNVICVLHFQAKSVICVLHFQDESVLAKWLNKFSKKLATPKNYSYYRILKRKITKNVEYKYEQSHH